MKKMIHRFRVYVTDDAKLDEFTKWKQHGGITATRGGAWRTLKSAMLLGGYRFAKITEERVYKGKD